MSYISITLACEGCDERWDDIVPRDKQNEYFDCPKCGRPLAKKTISAPMVLKQSYPDGTKRKGWDNMKEAAKLEKQAANLPPEKRKDIKKEIRKLKKTDK